jgi:hypothetical protein
MNTTSTTPEHSIPRNPNGFNDPYERVTVTSRIQADVAMNHFSDLRAIRATKGTIQTTINLLFHKLIHELRIRNIVDYSDKDKFEQFVAGLRLVSADEWERAAAAGVFAASGGQQHHPAYNWSNRPTAADADSQTPAPNDGRGAAPIQHAHADTTSIPTVIQSGTAGGGGSSGGKPAARATKKAAKSKRAKTS